MIPNFDAFNKAMEPYRQIMKNVEIVNKFTLPAQLQVNAAIASMAKFSVEHHLKPIVDKFQGFKGITERLGELFETIPDSLLLISGYGWYAELDYSLTYYEYLGDFVREKRIEELDEELSKHYRERILKK